MSLIKINRTVSIYNKDGVILKGERHWYNKATSYKFGLEPVDPWWLELVLYDKDISCCSGGYLPLTIQLHRPTRSPRYRIFQRYPHDVVNDTGEISTRCSRNYELDEDC